MFPISAIPYIPHELPMALIDEICQCSEDRIVTQTELRKGHLFVMGDQVPAWVGIELMAQSAAAWSGFNAQKGHAHELGQDVGRKAIPIGYLLGTRDYQAKVDAFSIGTQLRVHAQCLLQSTEGLGSFDCQIYDQADTLLAQARLSVFQPKPALAEGNENGN